LSRNCHFFRRKYFKNSQHWPRSKRCKREIGKQKSLDAQFPFVGAAVGIVVSTLLIVWDFIAFGQTSLISSPIVKGDNLYPLRAATEGFFIEKVLQTHLPNW
jgi:hypothetical protein